MKSAIKVPGLQVLQYYIPVTRTNNRPGYSMIPEYITVHDTGNPDKGANAMMHVKYLNENAGAAQRSVSWHYSVDDSMAAQHLPLNENGWHAGDGGNGTGNRKSIAIEICQNSDGDREKAEHNAIMLIAALVVETGIPLSKVVQHNHWSGKDCPGVIRHSGGWEGFIQQIEKQILAITPLPAESYPQGDVFKDIPTGHWAEADVKLLKEAGILSGYPDETYRGNQAITRYEYAAGLAELYVKLKGEK